MTEFTYQLEKHIATLYDDGKLSTELNVIRFGTNEPKYDLRRWRKLHSGEKRMQKGVTMDAEELKKLRDALNDLTL